MFVSWLLHRRRPTRPTTRFPFSTPFRSKCISEKSSTALSLVYDIQKSLSKISQSIGNLRMVVTDAASYNLTAFNMLSKQYENLKWVTCYSHLLGKITQKIPEFYKKLMSLIIWLNDLFSRTSLDKLLYIHKPPKIFKTRCVSFL